MEEIRKLLVNKQVELKNYTNSGLYILIELILDSIRQFFTYIEKNSMDTHGHKAWNSTPFRDTAGKRINKEIYFGSLELLRSHIHRCLIQIAKIANIKIPKISDNMRYNNSWELKYYAKPETLK